MKGLSYLTVFTIAILIAGCGLAGPRTATPTPPLDPVYTAAAQTLNAQLTQNLPSALPTFAHTATASPAPTNTPLPPPASPTSAQASGTAIPSPSEASPTATLQPTSAQVSLGDLEVLYDDDFSVANNAWVDEEGRNWEMGYIKGAYRIFVGIINDAIWSVKSFDLADAILEVDAARSEGPDSGYFGLVCRHQDGGHYYLLVIGADGTYGIGKKDGGQITFLKEGLAPPEIIRRGGEINRLRADCIGDNLALYVNGIKVVEAQDNSFGEGDLGIVAGTRNREGLEVIFDNFVVYQP